MKDWWARSASYGSRGSKRALENPDPDGNIFNGSRDIVQPNPSWRSLASAADCSLGARDTCVLASFSRYQQAPGSNPGDGTFLFYARQPCCRMSKMKEKRKGLALILLLHVWPCPRTLEGPRFRRPRRARPGSRWHRSPRLSPWTGRPCRHGSPSKAPP
jgi:hypothetical protein